MQLNKGDENHVSQNEKSSWFKRAMSVTADQYIDLVDFFTILMRCKITALLVHLAMYILDKAKLGEGILYLFYKA